MPIQFQCPACQSVLESPDRKAGGKVACPKCGQRLQIPVPVGRPSRTRTVLGSLLPVSRAPSAPALAPVPPPPPKLAATARAGGRPASRRRAGLAGSVLLAVLVVGLLAWRLPGVPGRGRPPGLLGSLRGDERRVVLDHLRGNIDDAASLEVAEWMEPRQVLVGEPADPFGWILEMAREGKRKMDGEKLPVPVAEGEALGDYKPGVIMHLKWRANNRLGAKVLNESVFLIQGGKVTGARRLDRTAPHDIELNHALAMLGFIAAERVGGKLTRVIVPGKLTRQGGPVTMTAGPDDERFGLFFLRSRGNGQYLGSGCADTAPPRYELAGITPGRYVVAAVWEKPNPDADGRLPNGGARVPDRQSRWLDALGGAYSPAATDLEFEVNDRDEVQRFDIDLRAAPAGKPVRSWVNGE